ncbi:uncharacterized, partial [Tachysurus ichikawai]
VGGEEERRAGSWWRGRAKGRKLVERKSEGQEVGGSKMERAG